MAFIIWRTIFERSFLDTICFSSSRDPGDASAFFQKSALNSPTITTLPYVGTISWKNLFGIISWEIYLVLSHGKYIWHYLKVGSTSAVCHRMKWDFPDESSDCHVISDELVFEVKFVSKVCQ